MFSDTSILSVIIHMYIFKWAWKVISHNVNPIFGDLSAISFLLFLECQFVTHISLEMPRKSKSF